MFKKAILRITMIVAIGALVACQSVTAQISPKMSTKYTLEQIDQMYKDHRMAHPRDTYPVAEINQKFTTDFPSAKDIEWEKSNTFYEIEFEIGRDDYKAYYDMQGELVVYKCEISEGDLPAVVRNAALTKYPNFKFEDIDKVVKGKDTFYNLELEKGKLEVKMTLKYDGTIIDEYLD